MTVNSCKMYQFHYHNTNLCCSTFQTRKTDNPKNSVSSWLVLTEATMAVAETERIFRIIKSKGGSIVLELP